LDATLKIEGIDDGGVFILKAESREKIAGLGQYVLNTDMKTADLSLVVRDDCHNQGIGFELISDLTSRTNSSSRTKIKVMNESMSIRDQVGLPPKP
jgi:hypothetical protein